MTLNALVSLGSWVPEPRAPPDPPVVPSLCRIWKPPLGHKLGAPRFHLSAITVLPGLVCTVLKTVVSWAVSRFGEQRRGTLRL